MEVEVIFEFIAKNPPMALIIGGILFVFFGAIISPIEPGTAKTLLDWAPWLIVTGVVLQILWLFR